MTPSEDTFALARPESILLDGANSVSGRSRQGFPGSEASSLLAVVVLVGAWVLVRRRPRWVAIALLVATAPGLACVLALRADAPLHRPGLAQKLRTALTELERAAPWPGSAQVTFEEDDVLFPLGRYALPTRTAGSPSAPTVELRGRSLEVTCAQTGRQVVCGAPP